MRPAAPQTPRRAPRAGPPPARQRPNRGGGHACYSATRQKPLAVARLAAARWRWRPARGQPLPHDPGYGCCRAAWARLEPAQAVPATPRAAGRVLPRQPRHPPPLRQRARRARVRGWRRPLGGLLWRRAPQGRSAQARPHRLLRWPRDRAALHPRPPPNRLRSRHKCIRPAGTGMQRALACFSPRSLTACCTCGSKPG